MEKRRQAGADTALLVFMVLFKIGRLWEAMSLQSPLARNVEGMLIWSGVQMFSRHRSLCHHRRHGRLDRCVPRTMRDQLTIAF